MLILLPAIGGAGAYFYSQRQDTIYEARATILVEYRGGGFSLDSGDFRRSGELASTYRRQVIAKPFLERVHQKGAVPFDAAGLRSVVSASVGSNPPVLDIRARHSNPELAAATAQVVADEFIDYAIEQRLAEIARLQSAAAVQGIANIQDLVAAQFTAVDSLSLLEPVATPGAPVIPRTRQNVLLGAILGLMLAAAGAFLLESLGDTVRFPDQVNRRFGITALGTVFKWSSEQVGGRDLVLWSAPTSGYAEAFRQIRANLQFATASHPGKVFLTSSPGPGEGKSTVISNLAVAFAQTGKRVVVVDGDLRRPTLHKTFNSVSREPGLSNLLAEPNTNLLDAVHPTEVEGVDILPSGPTPPNPAELLGSPRMATVLAQLSSQYDMVLVDSPPILLVSDGSIMASQVDGVVLVVDGFTTRSSALQACLDAIRKTQVNLLGVILNKLKHSRFGYGYGYPYYYHYYTYYKYYSYGNQTHVDGTGRLPARLARRAKTVWSRMRGR